jgi:broad specificity phosphatase PhoE
MKNDFDKVWQHVFQNSAETVADFVTRIESAFDTIHEENKDEHILVVAHS